MNFEAKYCLSSREKKALFKFKEELLRKFGKDLFALKLFGSKARGDARKGSDIDILVVLKRLTRKREDFILDLTIELLLKYGVDISPHIFSQSKYFYYKKLPTVFMQILEREAIPL